MLSRRGRHSDRAFSTCCSATPDRRWSATKSPAPQRNRPGSAVIELGRLQGPLLGDTALAEALWLNRESPLNQAMITPLYAGFVDRYGDQIAPSTAWCASAWWVHSTDTWPRKPQAGQIQGLVHGDYRLDNMLFGTAGADRALTVVDWQTVSWGPAMTDLAYFLGCALPAAGSARALRRAAAGLPRGAGPGAPISLADVREGVRRQSFFGVMMAIVSLDAGGAHRTRRPDVHDDAAAALRPCPGYRRLGNPARAGSHPSRCGRPRKTNSRTPRPPNRCGARAGMPTSPTLHRDWAVGFASA